MDCGEMDRWVDGWMDHGKKEENLREKPLSLYSPQPSSLINSQSRRGTAVPSTMCCGNADAKPVLGQPLIVSRLVPAASVFNWFPQLHSCPFLSPHPAAVSLTYPVDSFPGLEGIGMRNQLVKERLTLFPSSPLVNLQADHVGKTVFREDQGSQPACVPWKNNEESDLLP